MNIYETLAQLNISYQKHDHPPVYTCEEADKYYQNIPWGKYKNLLVRDQKKQKYYLIIMQAPKRMDMKKLAELIGEKKLSFASPADMQTLMQLEPGSVSPFGLINDTDKKITVVIDKPSFEHDTVLFHPNDNKATLSLSKQDLFKFLDYCWQKRIEISL